MNKKRNKREKQIIEELKTVYDPEFPMIDIYTLGLIYGVDVKSKDKTIDVLMTFTTPACPMADLLQEMTKNACLEIVPDYLVNIEITFDPMWNLDMIKDKDLKRLFE